MKMGPLILKNAFDSHVHWEATGAFARELNLSTLENPTAIHKYKKKPEYFRGGILIGYHWDDSIWTENPHRRQLDEWSNHQAVILKRVDRHAAWVSTKTLELVGLLSPRISSSIPGGEIEIDTDGWPTGILKDQAMKLVEALIPAKSASEVEENLVLGMGVFHSGGFTHIRDMTCDPVQLEAMQSLAQRNELRLAVEQYFDVHSEEQLPSVLNFITKIKSKTDHLIRVKGIKLFYDGALGSEGAWISRPYYGCGSNKGFTLYEKPILKKMIESIWKSGHEVAIHTIGDQAAQDVVEIVSASYAAGIQGPLHLEHAEMLRPETIQMMKNLTVTCHFQPCHWLSDKKWTDKKLGPLAQYLFRWKELEDNQVRFFFGSDAPIEPSSLAITYRALLDASTSGIPLTTKDWTQYVQHPDQNWVKGCRTEIQNEKVTKTHFCECLVHHS